MLISLLGLQVKGKKISKAIFFQINLRQVQLYFCFFICLHQLTYLHSSYCPYYFLICHYTQIQLGISKAQGVCQRSITSIYTITSKNPMMKSICLLGFSVHINKSINICLISKNIIQMQLSLSNPIYCSLLSFIIIPGFGINLIFYFTTYMHHRDYRIRGQKKTEDDFDQEIEQQLKLSTHAKGQKRQNSAVLSRKHQQSSQNSRMLDSRANSRISSNVIGSRVGRVLRNSRTDKTGVIDIQFNNVRWISIVSAYDSKRLKNVTVSKQSCETFLKRYGPGMKNDAAAMALFKDIRRHFQSWLGRINEAFSDVLEDFMRVNERAPLQNFKKMSPILESITKDTGMMEQKLEGCLKIYENNDFRKLFTRFQSFNQFSNKLQELIRGIYESKFKIDELFSQLENIEEQNSMDKKVEKIIKKGVKQAEHLIDEDGVYNSSIRDRIIDKVKLAINDLAEKSLNLFHRVKGAKDLIRRLHNLINDSRRTLQSSEIRKLSKIFKTIIEQAKKFQDFVTNFNAEQDHISPKLRDKLNQYSQNIEQQKRAVSQIQVIFVQTVINEAIQTLKFNYILNNSLSPNKKKVQYNEFNHTLQEIADAMLDQSNRGCVQGLIKHGKANFSKLDDELDKIKRALRKNDGHIFLDTENGQIEIMEYCNLVDKYKSKIKGLISKHEEALRNLGIFFRQVRLPDNEKDNQLIFLKEVRKIVQVVNSKNRRESLSRLKAFSDLHSNGTINSYGSQANEAFQLIQQFNNNKKQVFLSNQTNPLRNLIKIIRFQNNFYIQAAFVLQAYDVVSKINEKTLIENLTKLTQINSKKNQQLGNVDGYNTTKSYSHLYDRLYCLSLVKGLKKEIVKQLDDNKCIVFPQNEYDAKKMENQIKYRVLIGQTIGQGGIFSKNKIKGTIKVMKDMVSSYRIIQKLNNNQNGEYIILVQVLGNFVSQFFKIIISKGDLQERGIQCKRITFDCIKTLKNKLSNIEVIDQQVDMQTLDAALKARNKIIKVQAINQKALKTIEELSKKNNYLQMFSEFIHVLTEYIQQSKQVAYIALNQFKQPIWMGTIDHSKDGIIAEFGLKGYRRGTFTDQYKREAPMVKQFIQKHEPKIESPSKKQANISSPSKTSGKQKNIIIRQHSHQKESMDQEIAAIESDKDLEQNYEGSIAEDNIDDMAFEDEMQEEIKDVEDQFIDDMDEQINEDNEKEVNDELQEDIGFQDEEFIVKKRNEIKDVKEIKQFVAEPIKKQQPKQEVKVNSSVSVYEIIPYFKDLDQIRSLFLLIDSTELAFWSSQIDYQQIQDFYHRAQDLKDRVNFIKSLESCFSMFVNSRFGQGLSQQVKKLQQFISLKQKFNYLGQKNWNILFSILATINFSYSLLIAGKNQKDQILQIKIAATNTLSFKKEGIKLVIEGYLARTFKSSYFKAQKFKIQDYISNCFKIQNQQCLNTNGDGFHHILKAIPQFKQSLPDKDTHTQMLALQKIQQTFSTNLVTGIDLKALLIQLWVKAVNSDSQDYYKPDYSTLNKYIKSLDFVEKKQWLAHYLTDYHQQILKIREKIKIHKNMIDNTLFKIDSTNIWECIFNICSLYQSKINKQVIFKNAKQQKVLYSISESQIGITTENTLSSFLQELFGMNGESKQKNLISEQEIINFIQKNYKKNEEGSQQMLQNINNLLNILQIQYYYMTDPEFIIKNTIDQVVFVVIKNLNTKSKQDLQYDTLFHDLFEVKQDKFTRVVSLRKHVNKQILTSSYIDTVNKRIKEIAKEQKENCEDFKQTILSSKIPQILFNRISNTSDKVVQKIKFYYNWLKSIEDEVNSNVTSKQHNLFVYVKQKNKEIINIQNSISKSVNEISVLANANVSKQTSNMKVIEQVSNLIKSISKWAIQKGIAKHITSFSLIDVENKSWTFGLQFKKTDHSQFIKTFFKNYIVEGNVRQSQWDKVYNNFYKKYIDQRVQVKNIDNTTTEVNISLFHIAKQLISQIRQDLAQSQDILQFTRYYNQHRFNSSTSILKKIKQIHDKIIAQMNSKITLLGIKDVVRKCNWKGLDKINNFSQLFQCFSSQLQYDRQSLSNLIDLTEQIGVKETDLATYISWFVKCGVSQLKLQYYLLKSSKNNVITIFPIAKIEKDKLKSSQEIKKFLAEIKLPPKYSMKLQNGISTIHLQKEVIQCNLSDSQHYLNEQSQLLGFEPELPEGQMLLLSYYQGVTDTDKVPLFIGEIHLSTECVLNIKEYQTSSSVTCSIWKVAKYDYNQWKRQNANPTQEQYKVLRKKVRGLATNEQKIKDVCVGQTISFADVGNWLREELKKHQRRVEEKQRAEQQRKRIEQLTIAESEKFLQNVYHDMSQNESLPTLKLTLKEAEKLRLNQGEQPSQKFHGYWKKILDTNKKVIEKLQQSKSSEQMNRISTLTKDYLKWLKIKLISNQLIEEKMLNKANQQFQLVENKRKEEAQRKRKEEEEQRERKLKQKQELKMKKKVQKQAKKAQAARLLAEAEAAAIKKQAEAAAALAANSLNIQSNLPPPSNEPTKQEQVKAQQHSQQSLQSVQQQKNEQKKQQIKQPDVFQIILQYKQLQKVQKGKQQQLYMSYLIFLLEQQSAKDSDLYKCILNQFWKQPLSNRNSLVKLL